MPVNRVAILTSQRRVALLTGSTHHGCRELLRILWILAALALIVLVFAPKAAGAQRPVDQLARASDHLYNLEYAEARREAEAFLEEHPENLRALNLLAVTMVRGEMFRRGLLEASVYGDKGDVYKPEKVPVAAGFEKELNAALERAQKAAEARLAKNPKDEDAMYWLGVVHGTRGTYDFTLRRAYLDSLGAAKRAGKQHSVLLEINPQFTDAKMIVGVNNYVLGSLPWFWKMMASLTGARGDRKRGLEQIKEVAEQGDLARRDARFLLALLYSREGQHEETIRMLLALEREYPRNYLLQQELGSAYRVEERWHEAAEVYDRLLTKHKTGAAGFGKIPMSRIAYLAGMSHEKAGANEVALLRYEEAASNGKDTYVYRAELAAADLLKKMKRPEVAALKYRRVADEVPETPEGKAAKRALRNN